MTLKQNWVLRYGHFSDFLGDKMANFSPIDFKIGLYIKVNVNDGQIKFEVHNSEHLAKMAINWHRIGQLPLWSVNMKWT